MNSVNELLKLKRLSHESLSTICDWFNAPEAAGQYDANTYLTFEIIEKRFNQGRFDSMRIVEFEGKLIGWTDIHIRSESPTSAGLTVQISDPVYRGRGLGLKIHQIALTEFLKENKSVLWIEAWAHVENLAEQKILEKLNFKRDFETLKQFPINGGNADFYIYELEVRRN